MCCCDLSYTQGGAIPAAQYAAVSTGAELLAALGDATKRYIELKADVTVDARAAPGSVVVNRITEVRGCKRPGAAGGGSGRRRIDWSDAEGVVRVSGQLLFNGAIEHAGLGWQAQGPDLTAPVAAIRAMPGGVVEFEVRVKGRRAGA